MKARLKYEKNENGFYVFNPCYDYPNCNCDGHYVWEKNKELNSKGVKEE